LLAFPVGENDLILVIVTGDENDLILVIVTGDENDLILVIVKGGNPEEHHKLHPIYLGRSLDEDIVHVGVFEFGPFINGRVTTFSLLLDPVAPCQPLLVLSHRFEVKSLFSGKSANL